ncbi:MAG: hypothetical protein FJ293_14900 [Planctomycetes bacterium]|nr:hypothetical protein [Planctomycetota bacterium]
MPWCPGCRQEYRAGMAKCADCNVALVADLAAHDGAQRQAAAARLLRVIAPAGTTEALKAGLAQKRIPFQHDPGTGSLLVPLEVADLLEGSLAQVAECERVGDTLHVYGARTDREAELAQEPAWLERPLAELAREPAAAVPGLFAWLSCPQAKKAGAAAERLDQLAAQGVFRVVDVIGWAAAENLRKPLFAWAQRLAAARPAALAEAVADLAVARAGAGALVAVANLLHVVAKLADPAAAARVLPLLDHADPMVRDDADEVLVSLTGRDFGFDAEAEPAVRARAVALWREWFARNG